ncbi:MAG TPA: RecX family transcriptional regulator [Firmicutes bacterium]|nr:RecX family transcriptional regulator [Bacillota bacterium]
MNTINYNYCVMTVALQKGQTYEVSLKKPNLEIENLLVHEELILKYRLVVGKEISEMTLQEIKAKLDYGRAYQYALNVISRRTISISEMEKKLELKDYDQVIVDETILKLIEVGLLNDSLYCQQYVSTMMNSGKKGPQLIYKELQNKGIKEMDIKEALSKYSYELQIEKATKIVQALNKSNTKYGFHFLKQKIYQSLMIKGFSTDVIDVAISTLSDDETDENHDILKKEMEKLLRKHAKLESYQKRMKVTQTLARKGFSFDDISALYNELSALEDE